ncbi:MAG: hypothetical protein HQL37_09650 [Alphaproteobacteria bacterium]|nr:hypothetical protein [Alphaproteobacteria bacterium]
MMQGATTALPPSAMTADERLNEVAAILAAGLRRLHAKNQGVKLPPAQRLSSTSTGHQSGHRNGETPRRRKTP